MKIKTRTVVKNANEHGAIGEAADIIKNGGLVAFPTETVYGLGGNALDGAACAKIYAAKGRPSDNPLIFHIANVGQLAEIVSHVPESAQRLMDKFWPGPITIIFPAKNVPRGTIDTIGVRMPKNPVAIALITAADVPVAAPSANTSGRPSPTSAAHVLKDLQGKIDMILDGGRCEHGLESTVIDCTTNPPAILRPGAVTKDMIEAEIGPVNIFTDVGANEAPKAPGMKYKHYAPKARLTVVVGESEKVKEKIKALAADCKADKFGIMAVGSVELYGNFAVINMGTNAQEVAANLFDLLRRCDEIGLEEVFVESVSEEGLGAAIMNRLKKAASYNILEV